MTKVAAIQMASGPNVGANLIEAGRLIADAASSGAQLIVLPENFALMGVEGEDQLKFKEQPGEGPIQDFLCDQSRKHKVWLVAGTIPIAVESSNKVYASCLLINDKGEQVARYDKIHLFDVVLQESGERYTESDVLQAGDQVVVVDTPFGRLGIAVCYDLRFPELFRSMVEQGVEIIAIPSAFTAITGKAHWETLVRARAIENLSYVIAAGQGGYHLGGRETHGDSMVVDAWGNILDRLYRGSGVVTADVDLEQLKSVRTNFPCLSHIKFKEQAL